jgi:cbb3-type cytochrome oxidase subunit 1
MLRDFPPHDVSALGIDPPQDRSRGYRAVAALVWLTFVVAGYSIVLAPQDAARETAERWWPLLLTLVLAWQAAFVWLLTRLMALQMPER